MVTEMQLPMVDWQGRRLARLVLGHNPFKGWSHASEALDNEMRAYHAEEAHADALLDRAVACGINTCQFGGAGPLAALARRQRRGGGLQWIATLYGKLPGPIGPGTPLGFEEELREILAVDPPPIGIQHFGETTDTFFFARRLDLLRERLKRLRDTGLLVGVCSHLPEALEEIAAQDWDIDFYQASFYTVYSSTGERAIRRDHELFEEGARERMTAVIRRLPKPCIAFKVLAASRHCATPAAVRAALAYAYAHIKPCDVVCAGMWQKHADQVGDNAATVRELLRPLASAPRLPDDPGMHGRRRQRGDTR